MSLKPQPIGQIPELSAYVARTAFPAGNAYLSLRDTLGTCYDDQRFAARFPDRGQPAETPWPRSCSLPRDWLIARRPMRSAAESIGNTPSAWSGPARH